VSIKNLSLNRQPVSDLESASIEMNEFVKDVEIAT
jgi:hypothetical protein